MKVLIFGSNGLVGSSLARTLKEEFELILSNRDDTDLFSFQQTNQKILDSNPDYIINAAAKVGGILANNTNRTQFIFENLKINMNILESIVDKPEIKVINLGSSCIYPLNADNPIKETSLLTGKLEPTNSPYAMAKLASIEMGDAISKEFGNKVINLMPTNLFGPNDNFSTESGHVIPSLINKFFSGKKNQSSQINVWGSGKPLREFLYVDDLADAIKFIIENSIDDSILNIGSGEEITIKNLALKIKEITEYEGELIFDSNYPDGNPRKLLDSSKINNLGWHHKTDIELGLKLTCNWYKKHILNN